MTFNVDKEKTSNYFFFVLEHFLKNSMKGAMFASDNRRLDSTVVSIGQVDPVHFAIAPDALSCQAYRYGTVFQCLFIPYLQVGRRIMLLSTVPFREMSDLTMSAMLEHLEHRRVGYYELTTDYIFCIRLVARVACKLCQVAYKGQQVLTLPNYNRGGSLLIYKDLSPFHALCRLPEQHRVVYIDSSEHLRLTIRRSFDRWPKFRMYCYESIGEALTHVKDSKIFEVFLIRKSDSCELETLFDIQDLREDYYVYCSTVVAYFPHPYAINGSDAVFAPFSDTDEVASHILHALLFFHNRRLLEANGFSSF